MITTPYGQISSARLDEFCKIAGYKYDPQFKDWTILQDELEYWQLTAPTSTKQETKWQKRIGWLPIRDYNFQYACYKNPKFKKGANYKEMIKVYDLENAIIYAREKLFNAGKPIYLPEYLAEKANPLYDTSTKPPKSYNKILEEEDSVFN